jgi:hypothetical protein
MALPVNKPEKEQKAQAPQNETDGEAAREETDLILAPEQVGTLWRFSVKNHRCKNTAGNDVVKAGNRGEEQPTEQDKPDC